MTIGIFNASLSAYIRDEGITDLLFLYGAPQFAEDRNIGSFFGKREALHGSYEAAAKVRAVETMQIGKRLSNTRELFQNSNAGGDEKNAIFL